MMKFIKKNWWLSGPIMAVAAIGIWIATVENGIAGNEKVIDRLTAITENQQKVDEQILQMQAQQQATLDFILRLLTMPVGEEAVSRWRAMPQQLPLDSLNKPISNAEWLSISHRYLLGRTFKWINGDSILVRIEWDERYKRDTL